MANVTTGDKNVTFERDESHSTCRTLTGFCTSLLGLNIFFSITASLGNSLILIAIHKVTSIYPPTKLLFRCLAVSDLCTGLISQPLFCITITGALTNSNKQFIHYSEELTIATTLTLGTLSALTSTAVSVDRLLVLLLGLKYRYVVTKRRVRAVIISFWFLSLLFGCSDPINNGLKLGSRAHRMAINFLLLTCFLTTVTSYIKTYLCLRYHIEQRQSLDQQARPPSEGEIPVNRARYKRTVSTITWLQLAFLLCYLPLLSGL